VNYSKRKYVLDMLSEACMLGCRAANASIEANVKLLPDQGRTSNDSGRYQFSG